MYNETWVHRLKRAVERNLKQKHRFVCLTDMEPDCETVKLIHGWPGWWSKMELFRPNLFAGSVLYLDLDVIVTGSLDRIMDHDHHFTMAHDYYKPHWKCSTAMAWHSGLGLKLYSQFAKSPASIQAYYRGRTGNKLGDQGFIQDFLSQCGDPVETFRDLFGEKSIASYKVHKCFYRPPEEAAVVAFHGRPKPQDIKTGWVPEAWRM